MIGPKYNRLHLGDCIDGMIECSAQGARVNLAFADPPYNIGYSYDRYDDNLAPDAYLAWTERWMSSVKDLLSPSGAFWIAIGDEYVAELKRIGETLGLHLRSWVIWYYTFGVHCTKKFSRSHTHLLYFVKDPRRFTFNDQEIRVQSARQLVYNDARADPRGRVPDNTWILRPQDAVGAFAAHHDTWYFARVAGTFKERAGFHSCQLPERLLERIIRCCSQVDDIVLDPFAGSGSTLIVAKKLGRRWLGFESSPEYARHAEARVRAVRCGDLVEGPEDPLTSAPSTPLGTGLRHEAVEEQGLIEAFRQACQGYSVDRVITDPILNASFIDQCSQHGLRGRPRDWNLALLGLRKTGRLRIVPTSKRTELCWRAMDPFLFASEIALQRMLSLGYPSLDHVLCDPVAASKFDDLARSLVPGFRALEYRWAALRLRKDARLWRRSSAKLRGQPAPEDFARIMLQESTVASVEHKPAVYLLRPCREGSYPVYVGETEDLHDRAKRTLLARAAFDQFVPNSGEWELALVVDAQTDVEGRRGLQSRLIGLHTPVMNYLELADQPR